MDPHGRVSFVRHTTFLSWGPSCALRRSGPNKGLNKGVALGAALGTALGPNKGNADSNKNPRPSVRARTSELHWILTGPNNQFWVEVGGDSQDNAFGHAFGPGVRAWRSGPAFGPAFGRCVRAPHWRRTKTLPGLCDKRDSPNWCL